MHDVSHVPDYPTRSLRSGRGRDEANCNIAFSAGRPGGIQLSQLPDPRNVCEVGGSRRGPLEGSDGPGDGELAVPRRLRTTSVCTWRAHPPSWMGSPSEVQDQTTNDPVLTTANLSLRLCDSRCSVHSSPMTETNGAASGTVLGGTIEWP